MAHHLHTPSPTANAQDVTAKHTPGPWRQETGTNLVWGACNPDDTTSYGMGVPVAETRIEFNRTYDWDQALANARLIAAAPDVLAALVAWKDAQQATDDSVEHLERAIAEGWHNDPSGQGHIGDSNRLADAAWIKAIALRDAAIAKATAS